MEPPLEDLVNPIKEFEKLFKCHISFHDYTGLMRKKLRILNYVHLNIFCATAKKDGEEPCVNFDFNVVQSELFSRRKMLFKQCPAGIVELAVPIFIREQLSGVMFVGQFRIAERDRSVLKVYGKSAGRPSNPELRAAYDQLPLLEPEMAETLKCFAGLIVKNLERYIISIGINNFMPLNRRDRINFFIDNNFRKSPSLGDLAKYMGLSVPRISQLLNEYFGKGISSLVMEAKVRHAERLLCNSFFTMEVIGHECGFSSTSYFFRVFKKMCGCTPADFREKNSAQTSIV